MDAGRYTRLRSLFDEAILLPAEARILFAQDKLPDDPTLLAELIALLSTHDETEFLSRPVRLPQSFLKSLPNPPVRQVGKYSILEELDRGGMGVVYRALRTDDAFQKIVALKVMSAGIHKAGIEYFKRERQILAGLDHPNIARILDGGTTTTDELPHDELPYFVMEYVEGVDIGTYCKKIRASARERVRLFMQVCAAVHYSHDQGVIHGDLKPGNILVTESGQVKLLDFGISRIQAPLGFGGSTNNTLISMTPAYASPEQVEGRTPTRSSDVYSLGIVLYELLTEQLPFSKVDFKPEVKVAAEPEPLSRKLSDFRIQTNQNPAEFRRDVRGDLEHIVLAALQSEPSRRYGSVEALTQDLQRFLNHFPISTRSGVLYQLSRFADRNRVSTALGSLLIVLVLIGSGFGVHFQIQKARLEARQAEIEHFLAFMGSRMDQWNSQRPPVAEPERIKDVQKVHHLFVADIPEIAVSRYEDSMRTKQLLRKAIELVDRAEMLSSNQPSVRQEIALAYRDAADLQTNAKLPQLADLSNAIVTYQRAVAIAETLTQLDARWAEAQLAQLDEKLQRLGIRPAPHGIQETPHTGSEAIRAIPAKETPVPKGTSTLASILPSELPTRPVAEPIPAMRTATAEEVAETEQRWKLVSSKAASARRSMELIQEHLAAQQDNVHSNTRATMTKVDSYLGLAKESLDKREIAQARESLDRAEYELKEVTRAVGR